MSKLRRYRRSRNPLKRLDLCGVGYLRDDMRELMRRRDDCMPLLHQGTGVSDIAKDRLWRAATPPDTDMHIGSPMMYWTRRYLVWWLGAS